MNKHMLWFKRLQCISPLKDVMPTLHPRIDSENQKWKYRTSQNHGTATHVPPPQSLLSTFGNHAEVQHTIERILHEVPVSKATSEAGDSLISVGAH